MLKGETEELEPCSWLSWRSRVELLAGMQLRSWREEVSESRRWEEEFEFEERWSKRRRMEPRMILVDEGA